jgi:hypothetical protein
MVQFPSLKDRLSARMRMIGFDPDNPDSTEAFMRRVYAPVYNAGYRGRQVDSILAGKPINFTHLCVLAERLGLIPAIFYNCRDEPVFGRGREQFQTPVNHEYVAGLPYLGDAVQACRLAAGLTVPGLVQRVATNAAQHKFMPSLLYSIERHELGVNTETLRRLCVGMTASINWLVEPVR